LEATVDLILALLLARFDSTRHRLAAQRRRDDGYTLEAVVVISLMVILAIAVVGVIAAKVKAKADSINLNGTP
jgi:phage baseplate assembly protein gpV